MAAFEKETHSINGVDTVVYTAGNGDPVVLLHGAGTVDGFDFAAPWTDRFRVIAPYHPGFGESGDDPCITEPHDYVMHYLELFDRLELSTLSIVGLSFGGDIAARFAVEHGHRLRKLILIAPSTMVDPAYRPLDILAVPGEELVGKLVSDFEVLKPRLPEVPDSEFVSARYREATTFARLHWEHPHDKTLARYLHRIHTPTLIVWGDQDQVVPVQQAEAWNARLPHAQVRIFPGGGHLVHLDCPDVVDVVATFLRQDGP